MTLAGLWLLISSTNFLNYTRDVFVNATGPAILVSHLGRLSTLDRVPALTIRSAGIVYTPFPFPLSSPLYAHLTTLCIHSPQNPHVFYPPSLLSLLVPETLRSGPSPEKCGTVCTIIQHIHPLCAGNCCGSGISQFDCVFARALAYGLPSGMDLGR